MTRGHHALLRMDRKGLASAISPSLLLRADHEGLPIWQAVAQLVNQLEH